MSQCIESNPDIAGIGVRLAIYAQALLSLVHPIMSAIDGYLSEDELQYLHTMYVGILLTAYALLVSAFIQAATFGISIYHALIVLNLSWVMHASAITFFIYIAIQWFDNYTYEGDELDAVPYEEHNMDAESGGGSSSSTRSEWDHLDVEKWHTVRELRGTSKKSFKWLIIVLVGLASLHLSLMAGFGLWVWGKDGFGDQQNCAPGSIFLTVFTHDIPVENKPLKYGSFAAYAIISLPALNVLVLFIPSVLATVIVTWVVSKSLNYICGHDAIIPWLQGTIADVNGGIEALYYCAAAISGLLQLYYIVCTELMIRRSRNLVSAGESDWTFGQTLAVLLVFLPLLDVMNRILKEIKERRNARNERSRLAARGRASPPFVDHPSNGRPSRDFSRRIKSSPSPGPTINHQDGVRHDSHSFNAVGGVDVGPNGVSTDLLAISPSERVQESTHSESNYEN